MPSLDLTFPPLSPEIPPQHVTLDDFPAHLISPLTAVASSLANWNGEINTIMASPPAAPRPLRMTTPSWLTNYPPPSVLEFASRSHKCSTEYSSTEQPDNSTFTTDYSSIHNPWLGDSPEQCPYQYPMQPTGLSFPCPQMALSSGGSIGWYDAELARAEALSEYNLGLSDRLGDPSSAGSYSLFPDADNKFYEYF